MAAELNIMTLEGQPTTGRERSLSRRRYQRGSLILRGTREKKWVARWLEDVIEDGVRKRVHRSEVIGTQKQFPTKRLAQRELERMLSRVNSVSYQPRNLVTFVSFAEKWKTLVLPTHKTSAQRSEASHIKQYLVPYFGEMNLAEITGETIQGFVQSLTVAPKTVRNIIATLRSIWKTAKAWKYVEGNPFDGLRLPELPPARQPFLTVEQARDVIANANEPFRTMFWIVAETGMRGGEVCGLSVDDIDLEQGVVTVWRSAWHGKLQSPKTENAVRCFSISPELIEHLRSYLNEHWRDESNPDRLLFPTKSGRPLDNGDVVTRYFHPILDKLGLRREGMKIGLHALRHGNATVMDRLNVPTRVRQARLGHAQFATTFRYTHMVSEDDRRVARELGKMLSPGDALHAHSLGISL